jgi:hypothetical protein
MKKMLLAAAVSIPAALSVGPAASAVQLGILSCEIEGGTGYVVVSNKTLSCTFKPSQGGPRENYSGLISKVGIDVGVTNQGALEWAVLAVGRNYDTGQLAGSYYGVNAEATLVTGGGANLLVGGFRKSFTLQPLSVQAQTGINLAVAVTAMELVQTLK